MNWNKWYRWLVPIGGMLAIAAMVGCTGETKRVDPDSLSDQEVGTGLSSQDFRSVCERMARSLVQIRPIQNASTPPKVALHDVQNETDDYIKENEFTHKIRTILIKHAEGKIVFLDREESVDEASKRETRDKEQGRATSAGPKDRLGADYWLTGRIGSIDRVAGKGSTTYYRLSFRLTDAATQAIVWEDEYEIKKASTLSPVYR
ncbi:MAG TPA: hypothetical protein PKG54_03345 [Phycisphaerae bacterium]|jgi:uncharacterized protein (TIGR02722 family)|nr:hypothetical protein [Phycisphaerae bacterium]HOB73540.1 hypothetical protein [Phycisphaerae bacterium]HOJ54148.1 hypothetical protein [Phycisphaerae bacterium]HOL25559.1 hypothetical protein [Phycisphaerae bacterium]HPP21008.1 hypothetical protein [Phycisphaerae bacterium]